MKRFFFSLIALSAAAIGCTQSAMLESPEIFNQEVSFSPYTGRTPVTKATDIVGKTGLASAGGFQVYCFLDKKNDSPLVTYIDDALVTSNDGETWSYDKLVYWPDATSQSTLSFVAYSSNAVLGVDKVANTEDDPEFAITTANGLASGFTFTVPKDVDEQVDLLATAYYKGHDLNNTSSGKVTLQFQHLLSRVGFKVQTTTNKSVTINSLSFGGTLANVGTLDFDAQVINAGTTESAIPALNVSTQKATNEYYEFLVDDSAAQSKDDVTISNANQTAVQITRVNNSNYLMIMPQTVADQGDVAINVTYTISGSSKSKTAQIDLPAGFEFAARKAYEFILNISTSSIKFTVTEDEWDNPTEDDESYPLIPDTKDKVNAVAKVNGTSEADIILTAREAGLGTIGVKYKAESETTWKTKEFTTYTVDTPITVNLTGLASSTKYLYKPYSKNGNDEIEYSESFFMTKAEIAVEMKIDGTVTEIYPDHVQVKCTYPAGATLDGKGFCLVQGTGTPTINDELAENIELVENNAFKGVFNGLDPLTQYTCRAYVIIDGVLSYSEPTQFWTAPNIEVQPDEEQPAPDTPSNPPADSWEESDDPNDEIEF